MEGRAGRRDVFRNEKHELSAAKLAGITFSVSDSAPVHKFFNPDPDPAPAILQIWESDYSTNSVYSHRSNYNLPMFSSKKWPYRLLLLKWKSNSGPVFTKFWLQIRGSEGKTQNPAGVDSGTPDPVPSLGHSWVVSVDACCVIVRWFCCHDLLWLSLLRLHLW